jgi:TolB-like protein/Tfp pilus assembly protein PilF
VSAELNSNSGPKGAMHADSPCYVKRRADDDLLDGLLKGDFCYVLTSRQMGKSSLMGRTAKHLRAQGINVIMLDLQAVGTNVSLEQWYYGLVDCMGKLLRMEDDLDDFWREEERLNPVQRFRAALHDVILPKLAARSGNPSSSAAQASPDPSAPAHSPGSRLVIFIDEIDVVRSLPFPTDDFFAAINEVYNRRAEDPVFGRLAFCLLGVATPRELMRDSRRTPFNVGRRIELTDFDERLSAPLAFGWETLPGANDALLERIFYWTNGHPYLSQRLARAMGANPHLRQPSDVDALCEQMFFAGRAREEEDNLLFVRDRILRTEENLRDVLKLYGRIWNRELVGDDETNRLIDTLRLAGAVRRTGDCLVVRNRIYHRVFDEAWIQANLPAERQAEPGSIAVLPFRVLGPDQSLEYLADGLTEELISALGRVAGLRVASRTSAFQFKGKTQDVRKIASQLTVQNILEGSVRHQASDAHISAQLVLAENGHCVWSERYRYSQQDLIEIQDEIAGAIVTKLEAQLGARPRAAVPSRPVQNTEAYNIYLKGRFHWNRRTQPAVRRSIELFQEALEKDPGCAPAHAGLADAYNILGTYNYARPLETYPKAKAAATRALELDPNLAQAHCALGCASSVHDWDWARAESEFKQSIALNPSYATAHQWYAINCLAPLGRHEEALAELRRAQEVDPLSISIAASIGLALYLAGRYGEAIEQCRQSVELDPAFWVGHLFLGWACIQKQQFDEAVSALQSSLQAGNNDPVALAALAHAYGVMGRRVEALDLLAQLEQLAQSRYVPAIDIVPIYLALEELDSALRWLDTAATERSFKLIYLRVDPRLRNLQSHPQVVRLVHQLGLVNS